MKIDLIVADVMTKTVITVSPGSSLKEVVDILFRHEFEGVPVVDQDNRVVGIVTQYDLVSKSSGLHLPTFEKIFENLPMLKRDLGPLKKSFEEIQNLRVKDIMNPEPLTIGPKETVEVLGRLFVAHHRVNPIPVTDKDGALLGIVSRFDIISLFDPGNFASALGEFVSDKDRHSNQNIEDETINILSSVRKSLILVSRWRSILLYLLFFVLLILAFLAFLSIAGRISL